MAQSVQLHNDSIEYNTSTLGRTDSAVRVMRPVQRRK